MRWDWLMALLVAIPLATVIACGGDDDGPPSTGEPTAEQTSGPAEISIEEIARAVVQIHAVDYYGDTVWTGSGTFITPDGLILTNGHVVDDRLDEYDQLMVATSERTDEPAEIAFLAEIVAADYGLDLAVIRVVSDLDGNEVHEEFPFVPLGDSDEVEIGDEIRILGFPGIGGDTITFTRGAVSGFTAERSVGGRAWIKTDATIAGGNSGGLAVNARGELIGVPTIVGSGADTDEFVDCRFVADTNGDGTIGEGDDCVPVGGFINGLRPVNLAVPLVDAAKSGETYVSMLEWLNQDSTPVEDFDTEAIVFTGLVFSEGVTDDDEPVGLYNALPAGVNAVCGFWDYEGMRDGVKWDAQWYVDGVLNEGGSIIDDTWVGGESGNWWVCIIDEEYGLADGLYELVLSVEGEFQDSDAVFVGGDHPDVELAIENESYIEVCYAFVSPSGAKNWGEDDLGGATIPPGDSISITLAAGYYDLLTVDCFDEVLTEEYDLDVSSDSTYTVGGF